MSDWYVFMTNLHRSGLSRGDSFSSSYYLITSLDLQQILRLGLALSVTCSLVAEIRFAITAEILRETETFGSEF